MGKLDSFEKMYMHEGTLDFENGKKRKIFIDKWEVPSEYDIYFYNNENWDVEARLIRNHFILPAEGLLQYNRT